jgi:hypothetical protein
MVEMRAAVDHPSRTHGLDTAVPSALLFAAPATDHEVTSRSSRNGKPAARIASTTCGRTATCQ